MKSLSNTKKPSAKGQDRTLGGAAAGRAAAALPLAFQGVGCERLGFGSCSDWGSSRSSYTWMQLKCS